jgi:periplasmic divalent cation tolerance protein
MDTLVQITTTTGTQEDAERLAVRLVDSRLAACAQVSGPIRSSFFWHGQLESAQEWMLTAKTSEKHLPTIEQLLGDEHPYEVPELIATPIVSGGAAYLTWLRAQLT